VGLHRVAPQLFRFKKKLEGNTRYYRSFHEEEILSVVRPLGFHRSESFSEFFLPMVLHRTLKRPTLSAAAEATFRAAGLTDVLGSPAILRLVNGGRRG
jgi:hypothetical protein